MRILFALLVSLAIAPAAMAQSKPVTTASGMVYESLKDGNGESPKATDTVKVHYNPLLDRRRAAHETRWQGKTDLPTGHRLWRARRRRGDSAQHHAQLRS